MREDGHQHKGHHHHDGQPCSGHHHGPRRHSHLGQHHHPELGPQLGPRCFEAPPQPRASGGHHHHHGHDHGHHHGAEGRGQGALLKALGLTLTLMGAELVGGWWSGSLALWADAGHMLSDAGALALAWWALWLGQRPARGGRTYGDARAEVLAALANAGTLALLAGLLAWEAWQRWASPPPLAGGVMLAVGALGLLANMGSLWALHGQREASLNLRGAWLHVLTDALGSLGVIAAAVAVWAFGWLWADPLATWAIAALALGSGLALAREALRVLMEWAPPAVDLEALKADLAALPGVAAVPDLHVWCIVDGLVAATVRLEAEAGASAEAIRRAGHALLSPERGVDHATVEVVAGEAAS